MDLVELVARAQQGDHDAFARLAGAYLRRLDQTARLILRDHELARDAVQDALFRCWRDLPRLQDRTRFEAWLYRLTTNACLDLLRRRRRRAIEVELEPVHDPAVADIAGPIADRELLDVALRRLDPKWRAIVVLHYFAGLSVPDVASVTGLPLGTVKSRLHRSVAQLRGHVIGDEPMIRPADGGRVA